MEEPTAEIKPIKLKKKPKWMRILEQQSWQAELIVSGLAIVGSFQLPRLLNELTDNLLVNLPFSLIGDIPFYFIWYLLIAASVLQFNFLLHFALRALWIGVLGYMQSFHFTHSNNKEDGKITHISTSHCRPGTNMLKIVKEYFNEDGLRKEIYIPFIFDPKD